MNIEKAIECLKADKEYLTDMKICDGEEMDIAIKALEKQTPIKILHDGANWYRCPNGCEIHKKLFEKDWYCPKCGQRIDW